MNEHTMLIMSRMPLKPQKEVPFAADSLLYRQSVACLKGIG